MVFLLVFKKNAAIKLLLNNIDFVCVNSHQAQAGFLLSENMPLAPTIEWRRTGGRERRDLRRR